MCRFPVPTSEDQFEYLLRLYFGDPPERLSCCIGRAYLDMCRTLHGLAQVAEREALHARASAVVESFLISLSKTRDAGFDQVAFDDRHRRACDELCSAYSEMGFAEFRVGQAQKWLNMALKYIFVFGEARLPGYARVFELAHIPIDSIILDRLRPYKVPRLGTSWSRVKSCEEYMDIQRWVRATFPDSAPLAVESALWLNSPEADPSD